MPDSPTRERAGELLNLAGQATWIEQATHGDGRLWKDLPMEERAYWSARAYPAVLSMVVATTPGDAVLLGRLRGFYDMWRRHGILDAIRAQGTPPVPVQDPLDLDAHPHLFGDHQ